MFSSPEIVKREIPVNNKIPPRIHVLVKPSGATCNRPTSDVMDIQAEQKEVIDSAYKNAHREKPCPCGSQLSFKECHGWVHSSRGRRGRRKTTVHPRPPVQAVSQ
jgi:hypothetical protein